MGRAERRRLEKQRGKQVKTYNLTRSQLRNAVRQVTEEDLKRIKQEAIRYRGLWSLIRYRVLWSLIRYRV